jgi:hypothetical protein
LPPDSLSLRFKSPNPAADCVLVSAHKKTIWNPNFHPLIS